MKLYHGKYIIPALIVFLVIITFPIWYGVAGGGSSFQNDIARKPGEPPCILPAAEMRENHMQLLNDWRNTVVREGKRTYAYAAEDGTTGTRAMSLTNTCMACHGKARPDEETGRLVSTTAATYCQHCHDYVGVKTYCWDCHIDPVKVQGADTSTQVAKGAE